MNKKDAVLQSHCRTVMVPRYEELEPCRVGQTRYLMGQGGLYLETRTPWGHLVEKLWNSPRTFPYGEVEEVDKFALVFHRSGTALAQARVWASYNAASDVEDASVVVYDARSDEFYPLGRPASTRTATRITSKLPEIEDHESIAIDVHSHGRLPAYFSSEDNEDDKGGVRICVVFGAWDGFRFTQAVMRYVVEGHFFDREVQVQL